MAAEDERVDRFKSQEKYRSLPKEVRLDETISSRDTTPVLDPDAARNVDQHHALRDD